MSEDIVSKATDLTQDKPDNATLWSVPRLLMQPREKNDWIINGLLRRGSQMLIAAPPKSGKSLLAAEIALALTKPFGRKEQRFLFQAQPTKGAPNTDEDFPGLEIFPFQGGEKESKAKKSYTVLFVSLEMAHRDITERLEAHLDAYGLPTSIPRSGKAPRALEIENLPLVHMFGLPSASGERQDLRIVHVIEGDEKTPTRAKPTADAHQLSEFIQEVRPDVVIYDTLIQLHGENENDNVVMKEVLRQVRKTTQLRHADSKSTPIAHIVLHHTRKEGGTFKVPLGPEMMRGAGAIHGVADVVLLAKKDHDTNVVEVNISSRSSRVPNFFLQFSDKTLAHTWVAPKTRKQKKSKTRQKKEIFYAIVLNKLKRAGQTGMKLKFGELKTAFVTATRKAGLSVDDISVPTVNTRLKELHDEGHIIVTDSGFKNVNVAKSRFRLATTKQPSKKKKSSHSRGASTGKSPRRRSVKKNSTP